MSDDNNPARLRILGAAVDLIARMGPAKVSLRQIARQAEVSLGLIDYHFQGRQGLLESSLELVERPLAEIEPHYLERLRCEEDVGAVLAEAFLESFGIVRNQRPLMRVILMLVGQHGALPTMWRSSVLDGFLHRWSLALHERTGVEVSVARFRLHNVLALTTRYVAASEAEFRTIFGNDATLDMARDQVAQQIAEMARTWVARGE